jgi:hypothetical protein
MKTKSDENGGSRSVNRMVRHVFSVNVTDDEMAAYIKERADIHRKGFSGYFRDLVLPDMAKWNATERVRAMALAKLTDEERAALGFDVANAQDHP